MKNVLIKVIATVFVFYISILSVDADEWIEKTLADKEFTIEKGAELSIDHKFGEIKCENWDKSVISAVVIVKVSTSNSDKAQKIIDNTIAELKGNSGKVEIVCDLDQRFRKGNNTKVSVDLFIKMPSWIELNLESYYGSAYVETVDGPTSISSGYGNIDIVSLNNSENEVEIEYGNGNIGFISSGDIELSYSNLDIAGTEKLSIESVYSDLKIEKSSELSMEIEGGNLELGSTSRLDLESKFSNVEVGSLASYLEASNEYGNLEIGNVNSDFSRLGVSNEYGAVSIVVQNDASYIINATGHYGSITYPEDKAEISYRSQTSNNLTIKGVVGTNKDAKSNVELHTEYGSININ